MAKARRHLAHGYEFVESLERFLLDSQMEKASLLELVLCPACHHDMRVLGIESDGDNKDLLTFECTDCGHLEAMGAPAA